MVSQPALTSPDGSSNGKSPERCPRPLYSHREPTQEGPHLPHDTHSANLTEIKEEDEEHGVIEGHKDLDEVLKMEPPGRCPCPLYSHWEPTQEALNLPYHHQVGNLSDVRVDVKEEIKEEEDEDGEMEKSEFLNHKDLNQDTQGQSSSYEKPQERCPRPLYSHRDHTQSEICEDENVIKEDIKEEDEELGVMEEQSEGHKNLYEYLKMESPNHTTPPERCLSITIPHHYQGEDVMGIKVEDEVEETYVRDDQQYTEKEAVMRRTFIEEDTPTQISTVACIFPMCPEEAIVKRVGPWEM